MNRRRALISYEMRKMKWVLLIGVLAALLCVLYLSGSVYNGDDRLLWTGPYSNGYGSYFSQQLLTLLHESHVYLWILFAVIITVQFQDFHNKKTEEYMNSLPFTGRERFITKCATGYAIILISWLVMAVGTLIVRQSVITRYHKQALLFPFYRAMLSNETLWHTLRTLGVFALEMLAVYSLFVLVHSIVNKSGIASAVTAGIMLAPLELYYVITHIITSWTEGTAFMQEDSIWRCLAGIFMGDLLADFTGSTSMWEIQGMNTPYYYVSYANEEAVLVVILAVLLLAVIILCSAITWKLSKGQDMTKKGVLVSYRGARIFLAAGMGLCFGTAYAQWFPLLNIVWDSLASFVVNALFGSALFGFISWKLLKISIR